jgi:16S rRNA (cytidine1402-2'-O)-methyltransferase
MPGTLYLVATPIGNLQDITLRALETLRNVDLIACEDTRHTRKLLNHFRIDNRTISFHEHNENERTEQFIDRLVAGESIAVVSDAGTPGICDPGFKLVRRAAEAGVRVEPIPGPVAFVSALIASGIPTDSIFFGGFLPSKKGERRKRLDEVREIPATLLFYEAPHRLAKSLSDCLDILGDRIAAVAREITKLHEDIARGPLSELTALYSTTTVRGEIVLVIEEASPQEFKKEDASKSALKARIQTLIEQGLDHKTALKQAAKEYGLSKSEAYKLTQIREEPARSSKRK